MKNLSGNPDYSPLYEKRKTKKERQEIRQEITQQIDVADIVKMSELCEDLKQRANKVYNTKAMKEIYDINCYIDSIRRSINLILDEHKN